MKTQNLKKKKRKKERKRELTSSKSTHFSTSTEGQSTGFNFVSHLALAADKEL